jgi:hypothetical protein
MIDPILTDERVVIIAYLEARGKWTDLRAGARITIARYPVAAAKDLLQFSVTLRHKTLTHRASSVSAAIKAINEFIRECHEVHAPLAGRDERNPDRRGAAPLVRREA